MKVKKFLFIAMVLIGFVLPPRPAKAADIDCETLLVSPVGTIDGIYAEINKLCPEFPSEYIQYGMVIFQDGKSVLKVVNNEFVGAMPPFRLELSNSPLVVMINKQKLFTESNPPVIVTTNKLWITIDVDDISCDYRKVITGNGYWQAKGEEQCNAFIGK